jgi:hypothetical protein
LSSARRELVSNDAKWWAVDPQISGDIVVFQQVSEAH